MSFQDFVSTDVALGKYDLIRKDEEIVDYAGIQPILPSDSLMDSLEFDLKHHPQILSKHALCEQIIYPILREAGCAMQNWKFGVISQSRLMRFYQVFRII